MTNPAKSPSKNGKLRAAGEAVIEQLESRRMLSVAPHVAGELDGKVIYTQGGHGYTYKNGAWVFLRPYLNTMIEDLGNQDQIQPFADNLLHAGATVVSMRPVGHQTNEVLVDNSDTFNAGTGGYQVISGSWSNSAVTPYWTNTVSGYDSGNNVEIANHYAFATTSLTETAVSRFTPNIPSAGFYPVYTWYNNGTNRPRDATFRVNYAGGSIEVKVAQDLTGKGWVYLGTYYFAAGVNPTSGSVEVSNQSATAGKAVIADGMRFGNGMGDWTEFGAHPISGKAREDESALYWCYDQRGWQLGGVRTSVTVVYPGAASTDDETKNFSACDRYARYMNDLIDNNGNNTGFVGTMNDRLWISFHSNAGGGTGTFGLINDPPTPNQAYLANLAGSTVQNEMAALDPTHEFPWHINSPPTFSGGYSEISNNVIGGEFDATIIEVAFHDNVNDAKLLKNPQVRWDAGRAATHTAIQYFDNFDGSAIGAVGNNDASYVYLPEAPTNVRAITDTAGNVTVQWSPGNSSVGLSGPYGNAATGYRIWKSTNGYGFDLVATVAGGATNSYTISGLPINAMTYFIVTATNAGGESLQSYTVGAKPQTGRRAAILIVNNFKRVDENGDEVQSWPGIGNPVRARIRYNNSFDYVVQAGEAIEGYNSALGVESCTDESIANGTINLNDYQTVIWMSGEQSTVNETFTSITQPLVASYLAGGGKIFISGAEIAWDLSGQSGETAADQTFLNSTLHTVYKADDAGVYATAAGVAGTALAGVGALNFDNGTHGTYDVGTPDVLTAGSGATIAMKYSTGGTNGAVLQYASGNTKLLVAGFPFESIYDASQRLALMTAVLNYFGTSATLSDTTAPTATLGSQQPTGGSVSFDFTVTYADAGSGVNTSTFDSGDIFVSGPNGYLANASFISAAGNVVTYRIPAPGGSWDPFDGGTYTVSQNSSQVYDWVANARPSGAIGTFGGDIPFAYVAGNTLHAWYLAPGNSIGLTVNGSNVDASQGGTTLSFPSSSFTTVFVHGTGGRDTLDITGTIPQPLTLSGGVGGDALNVHAGSFTFVADASATTTNLDVTIDSGASAAFNTSQHLDDLVINGSATLAAGGSRVLEVNSLAIGNGPLDLTDNDLMVNYPVTSPLGSLNGTTYDGIAGKIASGAITSSADTGALYALGAAEAKDALSPAGGVFDNETVDGTTVLVKFTYAGDATLDGKINIDDYTHIDSGISTAVGLWFNGDFNYDGKINIDDYVIIDNNIADQGLPL